MKRNSGQSKPESWVLCCVDSRYIQPTERFIKRELGIARYFLKTDAGGTQALLHGHPAVRRWVLKNFRLVYQKRWVRHVVLVHHQDCLAYGGSAVFGSPSEETKNHVEELRDARRLIRKQFRDVTVQAFYAYKDQRKIGFKRV